MVEIYVGSLSQDSQANYLTDRFNDSESLNQKKKEIEMKMEKRKQKGDYFGYGSL